VVANYDFAVFTLLLSIFCGSYRLRSGNETLKNSTVYWGHLVF